MDGLTLIQQFGFPIACSVSCAWFIYKMYSDMQTNSKEREDKLYTEIAECRAVNSKALETLSHYAVILDMIQEDVKEIKDKVSLENK